MIIECFSNVRGFDEAQEFINDLNELKCDDSVFSIDYNGADSYTIRGSVTKADWDRLDLQSDFMEI